MFLVELVMQGVRGFRELARLRFQGGFNFVAAGNEAGKTTAIETMQRLLFPINDPASLERLRSRLAPDASRAALVMFSDDSAYYRIIEDFSKQAVNLSRYDASTKEFSLIHKDWDSATGFLSNLRRGISEEDYARLFVLRRDGYVQSTVPMSSPAPARKAAMPAAAPVVAPGKRKSAADEAKLLELRETLRKAEEAADAEYKAQAAKLALEEIRKKLRSVEEIEEKKNELAAKLSELKTCENLPQNLSELIETYERAEGQRAVEAEELKKHIEGLKHQIDSVPQTSFFTNKFFISGAALAAISFVAGVFVLSSSQQIYFYGALVVALALIAFAWYGSARSGAQRSALEKELKTLEQERMEFDRRVDKDSAEVKGYLRSVGAKTVGELKDKADNYRYFLSLQNDLEENYRRIVSENSVDALHEEYNELQQKALELEKAAREVAQNNIDTYAIRQDIERIEAEASSGAAWDFGAEAEPLSPDLPVFSADSVSASQPGLAAELAAAGSAAGIEMETLVAAVEAAAQRNVAAVSGGKYVRIEVAHEGGMPVLHGRDSSVTSYAQLSHGTRELVYFCFRTALVESIAGKLRLPFLLDDALAGLDPVRQKAACQILRTLGSKTQVILFSSNPALRAEGDAAAELK